MTRVRISIETSGLDATQATNLSNFLASLGQSVETDRPQCAVATISGAEAPEEKPKTTRNRTKKESLAEAAEVATAVIEEATQAAKEIEVVEPETVEVEEEEPADDLMGDDKPTITIVEIRALVSDKQAAHKEAIRGKLKEFDAANVTALPEGKYTAFHAFLKTLK